MEAVSALRIELYNELQGLPEALRSDFPDLAVDFLATVFRPAGTSPAKHSQQSARPADPPSERRAPLSQFQLLPCGADDKDALALAADVQAMLGAVQREAAAIESTAGATPAGGWGDLALPLVVAPAEQLKQLAAQQRSAGSRRSPSPVAGRPLPPPPLPAQLLECRRCHKVLMACAALQHQRQCSQVPEATVAQPGGEASLSQSDGRSSSDGVPAPAPSASRGSKRKRPSGSAAAAAGGAKASRMSKGGSMRAGSVELTPSLGEVVQGKLQPLVQPLLPVQAALAAPPPEVVAAVTAAPQAFPAGLPPDVAAAFALPPDVVAAFGMQPPSAAAQCSMAAAEPAAALAAPAALDQATAAAAPAAATSPPSPRRPRAPLSPTVRLTQQQRRPRSQHPPRMKRRLLHLHPGMDLAQPLVLNEAPSPVAKRPGGNPATATGTAVAAVKPNPVAPATTGQAAQMQRQPAAGAPAAAASAQAAVPAVASAGQQQPPRPQMQLAVANPGVPHVQPTAEQLTAQQQQARAKRYYEQCRIFNSLAPDQQQRIRQIVAERQKTQAAQAAQQQQQQQGQQQGQQQQGQQQQGQASGQPPGPVAQPVQQGLAPMVGPSGGIQQQMPQHSAAMAQQLRPQQPGFAAAHYAVVGMAVQPAAGAAAATVGVPLGGATSPGVRAARPSMPLPAGSRPVMVPQQQLMMIPGMAVPMRPGMVAIPAGTAVLPAGAVQPAGMALPGQLQHMQQQMVRPGMQQVRPVGLPGYPAGRLPAGAAQQQVQAFPAGMMVVPAGFAVGIPFGGSTMPGAAQAAASPAAASMPSQLADTASSPPAVPQQPAAQYHPYVRPAVVAGMPAAAGMPLPLPSVPAQPLRQQPGAASPSMHFVPNR